MAMINCPNCGKEISDKAEKCVHCGTVFREKEKKYCKECGAELGEETIVCPKCGCPIEADIDGNILQQVEVAGIKITPQIVKLMKLSLIGIISGIIIIIGGVQIYKHTSAISLQKQSEKYAEGLKDTAFTMLDGASEAETCGNLIYRVWRNAIYEESDTETDMYTKSGGVFVSDFNDALNRLFSDSSFKKKISNIGKNQETVRKKMKDMQNPPEKYKEAYESLADFYDAYLSLTNLVLDPSGSLKTYSDNFSETDKETSDCFSAVEMYFED